VINLEQGFVVTAAAGLAGQTGCSDQCARASLAINRELMTLIGIADA
jgi:hypothetical protein